MFSCVQMMTKSIEETGSSPFGELPPPREGFDMPAYVAKLQTIDAASFAAELGATPVTYPCVIVQCGSGTNCTIVSLMFVNRFIKQLGVHM